MTLNHSKPWLYPLIILLFILTCLPLQVLAFSNVGSLEEGKLAIYISPPILLADGKEHSCIYVQIQDISGEPMPASHNVTVFLASSNLDIGYVEDQIVISEGEVFSIANFKTTLRPGETLVTASAQDFITGSAILRTVDPYANAFPPYMLEVYPSPSLLPAESGVNGTVTVQLMDSAGIPMLAFSDINVTLTSSNTTVLEVPLSATIHTGNSYVCVSFSVLGNIGKATITALAEGFPPGNVTVSVVEPAFPPVKLALALSPQTLLPDGSTHGCITVQLLGINGTPAKAHKDIEVYISSSNIDVGRIVDSSITIKSGEYYAVAKFMTGFKLGKTVIAAAAHGLEAVTAMLEVKGFTPSKLSVYTAPPMVLADGRPRNVLSVQVQTDEGIPIASVADVTVYLTSSSKTVGTVPLTTIIGKGESYIAVPFATTFNHGNATITASAQGLESSTASIQTLILPLDLTIEGPTIAKINQTFTVSVTATSRGYPVKNAFVIWMVMGGEIMAEEQLTNENGSAQAFIKQTSEKLELLVQVSKPSYLTAEKGRTVEVAAPLKPPSELTLHILGLEVPISTIIIVVAIMGVALLLIYMYLKTKRFKRSMQT